jgi:hypothetical protein
MSRMRQTPRHPTDARCRTATTPIRILLSSKSGGPRKIALSASLRHRALRGPEQEWVAAAHEGMIDGMDEQGPVLERRHTPELDWTLESWPL